MTDYEILKEYALKLGYNNIMNVCDQSELKDFYVCKTDEMMRSKHGKYGQPVIIALNNKNEPYCLNRTQVWDLCRKM